MTTYRITVKRGERELCFVRLLNIDRLRETLCELKVQYPRCFFVLQSITT